MKLLIQVNNKLIYIAQKLIINKILVTLLLLQTFFILFASISTALATENATSTNKLASPTTTTTKLLFKKVPLENKHSKKLTAASDSLKYKKIKYDVAHYCQEKSSASTGDNNPSLLKCYNCKDPKTNFTYDYCVPLAASKRAKRSKDSSGSFYRFSDDYFGESEAKEAAPVKYKSTDEKCEKVYKDSMVCMVCEDPKTNDKYEQCAYATEPSEKGYSYSKSKSFGIPHVVDDESENKKVDVASRRSFRTTQRPSRNRHNRPPQV